MEYTIAAHKEVTKVNISTGAAEEIRYDVPMAAIELDTPTPDGLKAVRINGRWYLPADPGDARGIEQSWRAIHVIA